MELTGARVRVLETQESPKLVGLEAIVLASTANCLFVAPLGRPLKRIAREPTAASTPGPGLASPINETQEPEGRVIPSGKDWQGSFQPVRLIRDRCNLLVPLPLTHSQNLRGSDLQEAATLDVPLASAVTEFPPSKTSPNHSRGGQVLLHASDLDLPSLDQFDRFFILYGKAYLPHCRHASPP